MKTRFVLIKEEYDSWWSNNSDKEVLGVFTSEPAAWAHLSFLGLKEVSGRVYFEVEEVESFE